METARFEPQQEIPPTRPALAIGELDRQHLAPAVPVDANCDQYCLADDHAGFTNPLVARVEDQIGEGFGQRTAGELRQARIQPLIDRTDRGGRETVAAQLLGDRLHLARRNPLHVHLRQRRHQRPLRALVALKQLRREPPGAVLRHPQLEFADPCDQRPAIIARPVAHPACRPLALLGAHSLGHLRFEHLLQGRPHQRPQELLIPRHKGFHVDCSSGGVPAILETFSACCCTVPIRTLPKSLVVGVMLGFAGLITCPENCQA